MADTIYRASKIQSNNRPGLSVTFRHPLRKDSRGKYGLKLHRGLGTSDEDQADSLVNQLNTLLSDQRWWTFDGLHEAENRFDQVIVSAFYDGTELKKINPVDLREERIPLPTKEDGYARVMLVGTTGAGKTTLLRQIIGSDHRRDRFPSTSTARTTIADIEIIMADSQYEAAITFMSENEVRIHVEECLSAACMASIEGKSDAQIAKALLHHEDQRFRLSYILGEWQEEASPFEQDFPFDEDEDDVLSEEERITPEQKTLNIKRIEEYITRIKDLSEVVGVLISEDLGVLEHSTGPGDSAAWLGLFAESLSDNEGVINISHDLMNDIRSRFNMIDVGDFDRDPKREWPSIWSYAEDGRDTFLKQVRWFSSNHHGQFGKLLTPLVNGVRVRGQFYPKGELGNANRLVLLDGQGIGHTARSASSISTHITSQFTKVDMILLVDNAEQPMQAAPLALLRSVGTRGHTDKLAVAFTHFDRVKGDNLRSFASMKDHVMGSVRNAVISLRESAGESVVRMLEEQIDSRTRFLGCLDQNTNSIPPIIQDQMADLLKLMQGAVVSPEPVGVVPKYSVPELEMALRDAIDVFMGQWKGILGRGYFPGFQKEHWTRIKALSRRFAQAWDNEYHSLRPVADLTDHLQSSISHWLDRPKGWQPELVNQAEQDAAINAIRQLVSDAVLELVDHRMSNQQIGEWKTAYAFSGTGSSYDRARVIEGIYSEVAPPIRSNMNEQARLFRDAIQNSVREAIEEVQSISAQANAQPIKEE